MRRKNFICLELGCAVTFVLLLLFATTVTKLSPPLDFSAASVTTTGEFVTRSDSQLLLHGQPFRFAGANLFWLGLDDSGEYPSQYRINDSLDMAKEMGATVIRVQTLGISTGCRNCIEPTYGVFNNLTFTHNDYVIKAAKDRGLRLIIPLTDNWHFTEGGKHNFTDWRGIRNEQDFYSNQTVIDDFEMYIKSLLNHVNTYTGVAYKDDPTIMAWETGNELEPPTSWTYTISAYIKGIASHQLVVDGRDGVDPKASTLTNVDIVSAHYYPKNALQVERDAARAKEAGKVFYIGEFDWNDTNGGDTLANFLNTIERTSAVTGDTYWNLWSHDDTTGYFNGEAKYALYYPGTTVAMQNSAQLLRTHAYKMRQQPVPLDGPPGVPMINKISKRGANNVLTWRGAALAANYSIERSTVSSQGPWTVVCNKCVGDVKPSWIDLKTPHHTTWYRMIAYNRTNTAGKPSSVYQATG